MLFDNHDQGNHLDQFFSASVLSLKFLILPLDFFLGGGWGILPFRHFFRPGASQYNKPLKNTAISKDFPKFSKNHKKF